MGGSDNRVTFTIDYQNKSGATIPNAKLIVTVPNNSVFNAAANPPGWICPNGTDAGKTCELNLGNLAPNVARSGDAATVITLFVVDIVRPLPENVTSIDMIARIVDGGGSIRGSATLSVSVGVPTAPPAPAFQLSIRVEPTSPKPNENLSFALNYTNTGNVTLNNLVLSLTVPTHSKFNAGASTPGWDCPHDSGPGAICRFNLGSVAPGIHGEIRFVVTMDSVLPLNATQIETTVTITDGDGNILNGTGDKVAIDVTQPSRNIYLPMFSR